MKLLSQFLAEARQANAAIALSTPQSPPPGTLVHRAPPRLREYLPAGDVQTQRPAAPTGRRRGGASENAGKGWGQACALLRLRAERGRGSGSGRKLEAAGADRLASPFRLVPMEALGKLKQFDAYPKTLEDFRVKTCGGATGRRRRAGVAGRGVSWSLAGPPTLSRPVRG